VCIKPKGSNQGASVAGVEKIPGRTISFVLAIAGTQHKVMPGIAIVILLVGNCIKAPG